MKSKDMNCPYFLMSFLFLLLSSAASSSSVAQPGCEEKCGDLIIPYPFGTSKKKECYREGFEVTCDTSSHPPKLFLANTTIKITDISSTNSTATILNGITKECFTGASHSLTEKVVSSSIDLGRSSPLTFSYEQNKLTVIGCDTVALIESVDGATGCVSFCLKLSSDVNATCSGVGCCQAPIPHGSKRLNTALLSILNHTTNGNISNCSYAFPVDVGWYQFKITDVKVGFNFTEVPVVLDWAIGNQTCEEAKKSRRSHIICGSNSRCLNSTNGPGYRCLCNDGFEGNPYLPNGCQDINECSNPETNLCTDICINTNGNYTCGCPKGKYGDGRKKGQGCIDNKKKEKTLYIVLGTGIGIVFLLAIAFMLYWGAKKRTMIRLREKYFDQNGGELLKQKTMHEEVEGVAYTTRIFTEDELKTATHNFSEERVLGRGGNGTVYMGILTDNTVVAIKKSRMIEDQTEFQKEQFINEVIILSQIIHRNVVKIIGCCLETQVPLLVYEYIPNKTLYHHIHEDSSATSSPLSWSTRLRIAAETGDAVAYLHSSLSTPVIHRDIKSANILLDDNFTTKVSDFGASRLVPLTDQVEIATMVQGTLGYLDPEYFHTGQLTDKSDVYSFGVVLAELLTSQQPISFSKMDADRNLASHFIKCLKEDRLADILDPRVVSECGREELNKVALLTKTCLCPIGEQRPSMKEVAAELQKLVKSTQTTVDVDDRHLGFSGRESRDKRNVRGGVIEEMRLLYNTEESGNSISIGHSSMPAGHVKWSMVLQR